MGFNCGDITGSNGNSSINTPSTTELVIDILAAPTNYAHGIPNGATSIKSITILTNDNRELNSSFADWYWNDTNIYIDSDNVYNGAKAYIEYIP